LIYDCKATKIEIYWPLSAVSKGQVVKCALAVGLVCGFFAAIRAAGMSIVAGLRAL
jgi:hypothetical protein